MTQAQALTTAHALPGALDAAGVEVAWLDRRADLAAIAGEWRELAAKVGADIYQAPDWVDLWWDHFGKGRRMACCIARQDGRLVGVLPFSIETLWAGPVPVRIARLAGTDPHCMVFRLAVDEGLAAPLLGAALSHLVGQLGCAGVSFTPVSDLSDLARLVPQAVGEGMRLTRRPEGGHVVFDLAEGWEAFFARISKKRRNQFRRDQKALEEAFGMTPLRRTPDAAAFGEFVRFHNTQWQAVGKGGHFRDWPGSEDFYRALADRAAPEGQVQLLGEAGRDGLLSDQFVLIAGGTAHWRLPARSLDPEAERLSVGKVGLLRMIETLAGDGVRRIEAGRGEYGYKISCGGEGVPVHGMIVGSARTAGRLRLLLAWADMLHLVYYRIWFLKLAPRVRRLTGWKSRPLWRSWIRTRL